METDDAGSPVVVVVVRCPAEPIQQEEKGCKVRIGRAVKYRLAKPGIPSISSS